MGVRIDDVGIVSTSLSFTPERSASFVVRYRSTHPRIHSCPTTPRWAHVPIPACTYTTATPIRSATRLQAGVLRRPSPLRLRVKSECIVDAGNAMSTTRSHTRYDDPYHRRRTQPDNESASSVLGYSSKRNSGSVSSTAPRRPHLRRVRVHAQVLRRHLSPARLGHRPASSVVPPRLLLRKAKRGSVSSHVSVRVYGAFASITTTATRVRSAAMRAQ
ncbi:hypothetical protein C8R46DRAFT_46564 [Mycena filopes]|nr:hypothetical protein C8R46DRAFT_46564 [Mycena filopes]